MSAAEVTVPGLVKQGVLVTVIGMALLPQCLLQGLILKQLLQMWPADQSVDDGLQKKGCIKWNFNEDIFALQLATEYIAEEV